MKTMIDDHTTSGSDDECRITEARTLMNGGSRPNSNSDGQDKRADEGVNGGSTPMEEYDENVTKQKRSTYMWIVNRNDTMTQIGPCLDGSMMSGKLGSVGMHADADATVAGVLSTATAVPSPNEEDDVSMMTKGQSSMRGEEEESTTERASDAETG
jgi:hypothetical protein